MQKISTIIVGYNSKQFLPACIRSVLEQEHWNGEILYIDNASWDGSVGEVSRLFPDVHTVALNENIGLAAANNLGISMSHGSFICFLNPDVVLERDYFTRIMETFESGPRIAGCVGKLYRCQFEDHGIAKSTILDSTGHVMHKNRQVTDRGQGEEDTGQYDRREQVFSIVGAASIYRKVALDDIRIGSEYLDEDFKQYKDDIDLGWRARLRGWELWYEPRAVGYHARGWQESNHQSRSDRNLMPAITGRLSSRKKVPDQLKYHSFRNRHLMMIKNELGGTFWPHLLPILWFELRALVYAVFRERILLKAWGGILRDYRQVKDKRIEILKRRSISARELRRWFR